MTPSVSRRAELPETVKKRVFFEKNVFFSLFFTFPALFRHFQGSKQGQNRAKTLWNPGNPGISGKSWDFPGFPGISWDFPGFPRISQDFWSPERFLGIFLPLLGVKTGPKQGQNPLEPRKSQDFPEIPGFPRISQDFWSVPL